MEIDNNIKLYLGSNPRVRNREGTNALYKTFAVSFLLCMNQFRSTKFPKTLNLIGATIDSFRERLARPSGLQCLTTEELCTSRLLKKKHYYYGAYLAALTSFPMLSLITADEQVRSSMLAKTAAITSIKVLDNINDQFSGKQEAVESQKRHLDAFTCESFGLGRDESFMGKAENSCMEMARWTFQLVRDGLDISSKTLGLYMTDFTDYIEGQIRSMDEKVDGADHVPTIKEYIQKINEKSVGKIWVDIDFCFFEKVRGQLDEKELEAILCVRKAADYFFKGCNIYDDIADLDEDLRLGILSSVPLLALDMGKIERSDLKKSRIELVETLRKRDSINDAVHLGDLIFLQGLKPLMEAKRLTGLVDVDALVFGAKVLRMFAIRKWLFKERNLESLYLTALSMTSPQFYRIPESITAYAKLT